MLHCWSPIMQMTLSPYNSPDSIWSIWLSVTLNSPDFAVISPTWTWWRSDRYIRTCPEDVPVFVRPASGSIDRPLPGVMGRVTRRGWEITCSHIPLIVPGRVRFLRLELFAMTSTNQHCTLSICTHDGARPNVTVKTSWGRKHSPVVKLFFLSDIILALCKDCTRILAIAIASRTKYSECHIDHTVREKMAVRCERGSRS